MSETNKTNYKEKIGKCLRSKRCRDQNVITIFRTNLKTRQQTKTKPHVNLFACLCRSVFYLLNLLETVSLFLYSNHGQSFLTTEPIYKTISPVSQLVNKKCSTHRWLICERPLLTKCCRNVLI